MTRRQLALTKTPINHGTYCIRLNVDGSVIEWTSHTLTLDELLDSLNTRLADIERIRQPTSDPEAR